MYPREIELLRMNRSKAQKRKKRKEMTDFNLINGLITME